jgi:hypothetical protein
MIVMHRYALKTPPPPVAMKISKLACKSRRGVGGANILPARAAAVGAGRVF